MEDVVRKIIRRTLSVSCLLLPSEPFDAVTLQNGLITTVWTVSDLIIAVTSAVSSALLLACAKRLDYANSFSSTMEGEQLAPALMIYSHIFLNSHSHFIFCYTLA